MDLSPIAAVLVLTGSMVGGLMLCICICICSRGWRGSPNAVDGEENAIEEGGSIGSTGGGAIMLGTMVSLAGISISGGGRGGGGGGC